MKNLSPRQQEIMRLVNLKGDLSMDEIRQLTGASQATMYREVQSLTKMGLVMKVAGGISRMESGSGRCFQCGHENNSRTAFSIEQKDGKKFSACCAHCGFIVLSKLENISLALTTDFLYGILLNVGQAFYVFNSDVDLCCHPSILSFKDIHNAERFARGFGGEVMDFPTAKRKNEEFMSYNNFHTL